MRLLHWSWLRNDQIPSSLKNAAAERDRFPFPLSAARIALTVVALGVPTSKGKALSAATRTSTSEPSRTPNCPSLPTPSSPSAWSSRPGAHEPWSSP
jgi:hypothetical protein